jgi:beta-glucanase (GH16 family)|eukprot:COSAG01_NODE_5882_length_3972_cov_2.539117_2_plen_370_part_00
MQSRDNGKERALLTLQRFTPKRAALRRSLMSRTFSQWRVRRVPCCLVYALLSTPSNCRAQVALTPPPPPPGAPTGFRWKLAWEEEFEGPAGTAPNTTRWTVAHNRTHGTLEQQLYVRQAVALDGAGHCVITTARAPQRPAGPGGTRQYNFTSGWLDTQGKVERTFGRWEVSAQLPPGSVRGIWPAHWLMPRYEAGGWNCWPVGGEIDIMEMTGGVYNNTVLGTFHWGANCSAGQPPPPPGDAECTCGCGCDLHKLSKLGGQFECVHPDGDPWRCQRAHDFSTSLHVFAVEWEPTAIRWFVDGKLFWTRTLGVDHVSYIPQQPLYIILNTAIQPELWNKGAGTEGSFPAVHVVDYVRVWERSVLQRAVDG